MKDSNQKKSGRFIFKVVLPVLGILIAFLTFLASILVPEIRDFLGLSKDKVKPEITAEKSDIYFDNETLFLFSADKGKGLTYCEGRMFFNTHGAALYVYSCPDNKRYYEIGSYEIVKQEVQCIFNGTSIVVDSNFYTNQTDISVEYKLNKNMLFLKEVEASGKNRPDYFFESKHITYSCKRASNNQLQKFIRTLKEEGSYDSIQKFIEINEASNKSYAKMFFQP